MHYDYASHAGVCRLQRLCNKIGKIKLFANLMARLFQETGGLSRWQELINKEKIKNKI